MNIKLPPLFPLQKEIAQDDTRFKVVAAGRRAGKTRMCAAIMVKAALEGKRCWWCGPFLAQAQIGFRELKLLSRQIPGVKISETKKNIIFPSGGEISVKSVDNEHNLRGEGLDLLVCDEVGFYRNCESIWMEALRPTLSDRKGSAIFISTPKGFNFFHTLFSKGNDEQEQDWKSWHYPSNANPFFPEEEFEIAKRELPNDIFQQEYCAVFLKDGGTVFKNLSAVIKPLPNNIKYHSFCMGVDLARIQDYTVLTIMDRTNGHVIEVDRFNQVDWEFQRQRIERMARKYNNCEIQMDANSIGDVIVQDLNRRGLRIKPFKYTNESKTKLIQDLILGIEDEKIIIPPKYVQTINELKMFTMDISPTGKLLYSHPPGGHDDCVQSLALAYGLTSKAYSRGSSTVFLAR